MGDILDAAIAINILADLIISLKKRGIDITPENIFDKVKELEAEKDALNKQLGI